jgi:hypothetical protein
MASPCPHETVSHCHDVLHVGSLPYFSIRHSVAPDTMQYFPFHLLLTILELLLFCLVSDHVRAFGPRIIGLEMRKIPGRLSLSLVFGFVGQHKPHTLELVPSHSNSLFFFFSRVVPEWYQLS